MTPEHITLEKRLRHLAANASIEVTPDALAPVTSLGRVLGHGRTVYVPFLRRADIASTAATCRRLIAEGLVPVPHIAARAVPSRRQLDDWLVCLVDAGVERVLLVAGDARKARGPFRDTLAVLETGLLAQRGIRRVGVAGYPEGHPRIANDALWQVLEQKAAYARETGTEMWLVSQFAFEAAPVVAWLRAVHDAGLGLPVRVGVAGPAHLRTLLGFALRCGLGASAAAVMQRPSAAFRLAGRWDPTGLLADMLDLQTLQSAPQSQSIIDPCLERDAGGKPVPTFPHPALSQIHIFAFGGVLESAAWLDGLRETSPCVAGFAPLQDDGADRIVSY